MGCLSSSDQTSQDKQLASELAQEKKKDKSSKKLLFLGAGGAGKSTVFKQLKRIHGEGWSIEYRIGFIKHIHSQIIMQMRLAIECVEFLAEQHLIDQYGDDYKHPPQFNPFSQLSYAAQNAVNTLNQVRDTTTLTHPLSEAIKVLWNESIIKQIYEDRATMKIEDTTAFFWDRIDEIMNPQYVPDETDVLLARHRSTGVVTQTFSVGGHEFHIFDVGGQKSERKKWIHCFEDVTCVIFVVSLSCYDEIMFEDETVNSMSDSLELFGTICNNEWFESTSMILFLNKTDLFRKKLKEENKPITLCPEFEYYEGDTRSFSQSVKYIESAFQNRNESQYEDKEIFIHLTCATDRNNIQKVFNDVQTLVLQSSMSAVALF